uniref:Putative secreted protein n=1 Tax=Anopheles darlingi TaxID=43151 RepID=A0A2M4DKE1_ANODA
MVAFRLCIGGLLLVMIHGCLLVVRSAVLLETGLRQYGVAVAVAATAHRSLIPIHHQLTALVDIAAVVVVVHH